MRLVWVAGLFLVANLAAAPAVAQDKAEHCAETASIVMDAVDARKEGVSKAKARRVLRDELDRAAGDMLADWIWALPEEQLTAEIGAAWETQCLAQ